MHKSAFDKNSQVMQIWLSKNLLGMTDRPVGTPDQYLDDFLKSLGEKKQSKSPAAPPLKLHKTRG
jgi:hypothetical protein